MKAIILLILVGPVAAMMIGCSPQASPGSSSRTLARDTSIQPASLQNNADKYLIVNCKYPPRIRTTGGLVMQIPRRPEKTTREQCIEQGGRPVSAPEAWGELAEKGDVEAQVHVGDHYARGAERVCDLQAAQWYQRAIQRATEAGDSQTRSQALFRLGYLYETGCGIDQDLARAEQLYEEAHGDPHKFIRSVDLGDYHALVIGNNNYRYLSNLNSAINDAKEVARLLERKYGFNVRLLTDVTRVQILNTLEDFRRDLKEKDNLLIYYAGHGFLDEINNRGYWQPVDAASDSRAQWIKTEDVTDILNVMTARRVLLVSDSCYSGAFARSLNLADIYPREVTFWIHRMSSKRARLVLASGGLEPVLDCDPADPDCKHSVFARYFIQILQDNDEYLVGRQLFEHLDVLIPHETRKKLLQEPVYAPMYPAGHDGGEFFFEPVGLAMKQDINPIPYAWLQSVEPVLAETIAAY